MKLVLKRKGKRHTIKKLLNFSGPAPFKRNQTSNITIKPSSSGKIRFVSGKQEVFANYKYIRKEPRGRHTSLLGNSSLLIYHTEHLLSVFAGLGIDSCDIFLNGIAEIPDVDTSAKTFATRISEVGNKRIGLYKEVAVVEEEIFFKDSSGSLAILRPSDKTFISALIQFPEPIGEQYFKAELNPAVYLKELSWARSFIRRGCDKKIWELARKELPRLPKNIKDSPAVVFDKDKEWIVAPKKPNEPVRHKIVDIIGDLATLGYPIKGSITIIRPGHEFNRKLVRFFGNILDKQE